MSTLPELKSGDVLITAAGRKVIVRRIKRHQRDTGIDEPIFRLIHLLDTGKQLAGNAEWTREELQTAGMRMA